MRKHNVVLRGPLINNYKIQIDVGWRELSLEYVCPCIHLASVSNTSPYSSSNTVKEELPAITTPHSSNSCTAYSP